MLPVKVVPQLELLVLRRLKFVDLYGMINDSILNNLSLW